MEPTKHEHDEEQQAFIDQEDVEPFVTVRARQPRGILWYFRIAAEVAMALALAALLVRPISDGCQRPLKPTPVPSFPKKIYTFVQDPKYLNDEMFTSQDATLHTLHNWLELSSASRGYVQFSGSEIPPLNEPYQVRVNHTHEGPGYMVSAFHQLHCLSYLVQHFQAGYGGTELTEEVAHHSAHCFDYLRQALMCAADTSLEGKTPAGPGWGSEHECTDYDALLNWANEHATDPWRTALMPDTAVL